MDTMNLAFLLFGVSGVFLVKSLVALIEPPRAYSHTTYTHHHETLCVSCKQRGPYR